METIRAIEFKGLGRAEIENKLENEGQNLSKPTAVHLEQLRTSDSSMLRALPYLSIDSSASKDIVKEYNVKSGDSLWKIAAAALREQSLQAGGHDIKALVQEIIKANKERYPQLAKNPHLIDSSMTLLIPRAGDISSATGRRMASPLPDGEAKRDSEAKRESEAKQHKSVQHETGMKHDKHGTHDTPEQGRFAQHEIEGKAVRASWYGGRFQGRQTASGERYDINLMTAAHKTLPFGTLLELSNPSNGHRVIVKINDRGPFVPGRELDLTPKAARALGTYEKGVAPVSFKVVGRDI